MVANCSNGSASVPTSREPPNMRKYHTSSVKLVRSNTRAPSTSKKNSSGGDTSIRTVCPSGIMTKSPAMGGSWFNHVVRADHLTAAPTVNKKACHDERTFQVGHFIFKTTPTPPTATHRSRYRNSGVVAAVVGIKKVPSASDDTEKEFRVIAGGGGRTPVKHVIWVGVYVFTVHITPFTMTSKSLTAPVPNPVPVIVNRVLPRDEPLLGDTAVMFGDSDVWYWNVLEAVAVAPATVAAADNG